MKLTYIWSIFLIFFIRNNGCLLDILTFLRLISVQCRDNGNTQSHSNLSLPPILVLVYMTQCDELLQFDWRINIAFNKLLREREREITSKLTDGKRHPDLTQSHTPSLIWSTLEPSEGRLFVQLLIKWRCSYFFGSKRKPRMQLLVDAHRESSPLCWIKSPFHQCWEVN